MKRSQRSWVLAAAVVASLAGTAGALAVAQNDGASTPANAVTAQEASTSSPYPPPRASIPWQTPAAIRSTFEGFRRAERPEDRLSAEVGERLAQQRANGGLARLVVPSQHAAWRGYAVPAGDDSVCLVSPNGSGGCLPAAAAREEGALGVNECLPSGEDLVQVFGLMPDGVKEVKLTSPGGKPITVAVESNGWAHVGSRTPAAERPTHVSWTGPSGTRTVQIGYSPDVNVPCQPTRPSPPAASPSRRKAGSDRPN